MKKRTQLTVMSVVIIAGVLLGISAQLYRLSEVRNDSAIVPAATSSPAVVEKEDAATAAREILELLAVKDYDALATRTSRQGLTLNEVPSLDLETVDVVQEAVSQIPVDTTVRLFGYADGSGEPIELTVATYLDAFIYNHDYVAAPQVGVNQALGYGNNRNTILADAAPATVVAFHFPGFDSQYEGMDWTTLYVVLTEEDGAYMLRGLAKDNWAI